MLCNYNGCGCPEEQTTPCSRCQSGIMILVGIIGGLVFAAVTALLFINNFLAEPVLSGWVALISGLVCLGGLTAAAAASRRARACICCMLGSLMFGIFGTIFTGYLGIAATITVGAVFSTIIVALTAFFFAYMIIGMLFLISCLADCD